jgi:hypothetical protein
MEESFNSSTDMVHWKKEVWFSMCLCIKKGGEWVRHANRII